MKTYTTIMTIFCWMFTFGVGLAEEDPCGSSFDITNDITCTQAGEMSLDLTEVSCLELARISWDNCSPADGPDGDTLLQDAICTPISNLPEITVHTGSDLEGSYATILIWSGELLKFVRPPQPNNWATAIRWYINGVDQGKIPLGTTPFTGYKLDIPLAPDSIYQITFSVDPTDIVDNGGSMSAVEFTDFGVWGSCGRDDTTAPEIICPSDVTVACGERTDPAETGFATATDSSGVREITYADSTAQGSTPGELLIYRTWTASDSCCNSSSCLQLITTYVGSFAVGQTLNCNTTGVWPLPIDEIPCVKQADLIFEGGDPPQCGQGVNAPNGRAIYMYVDQLFNLSYENTSADTMTGWFLPMSPDSLRFVRPAEDNQRVTHISYLLNGVVIGETDLANNWNDADTVFFPVPPGSWELTIQVDPADIDPIGLRPAIYWTAFGLSGDCGGCPPDTTADLTISCPADLTLDCDVSTDTSVTGVALANDTLAVVTYTDSTIAGNCPVIEQIYRIWYATTTDTTVRCTQIITVEAVAPTITCPNDMTIGCLEELPVANTAEVTTSGCLTQKIEHIRDDTLGTLCSGSVIRTFLVTDSCGVDSCTQVFTWNDQSAPTIICPADITVDCTSPTDPSVTGNAVASDICGSPTVAYTDESSDTLIVRTWTATDLCGNTDSCTQVITIEQSGQLEITSYPDDLVLECGDTLPVFQSLIAVNGCGNNISVQINSQFTPGCTDRYDYYAFATDAAGSRSDTVRWQVQVIDTEPPVFGPDLPQDTTVQCGNIPENDSIAVSDCSRVDVLIGETSTDLACGSLIQRRYIATDCAGNQTEHVQLITVTDTVPPILMDVPVDLTVSPDSIPDINSYAIAAVDDCSGELMVDISQVMSDTQIVRTFSAIDACGNMSRAEQIITISSALLECEFRIYPTPTTNGQATVLFGPSDQLGTEGTLRVYSMHGRLLHEEEIDPSIQNNVSVNLGTYSGIFHAVIAVPGIGESRCTGAAQ